MKRNRFLLLLVIAWILGALIAWRMPDWQSRILSPGMSLSFNERGYSRSLLLRTAGSKDMYQVINAEMAAQIGNAGRIVASPGVVIHEPACKASPWTVRWSTRSMLIRTINHTAPGFNIVPKARIEVAADARPGRVIEVKWGGEVLAELRKIGTLEAPHGVMADEDHLLLARLPFVENGFPRVLALVMASFQAGSSFGTVILVILLLPFMFKRAGKRPSPSSLPLFFGANPAPSRSALLYFWLPVAGVAAWFAWMELTSEIELNDLNGVLNQSMWVSVLIVLAGVGLDRLALRTVVREVRLTQEGIEVNGGPRLEPLFRCPWNQLAAAVPMEMHTNGVKTMSWIELVRTDGARCKVQSNGIKDFNLFRDVILQFGPAQAAA